MSKIKNCTKACGHIWEPNCPEFGYEYCVYCKEIRPMKSHKRWGLALVLAASAFIVLMPRFSEADMCAPVKAMSKEQVNTISYAYFTGYGEDLGMSMATIAWHESYAGRVIVGDRGKSFGAYHMLATTSMHVNNTKDSFDNYNREATKLLDLQYSSDQALKYLKELQGKTSTWKGMVTKWNTGSEYGSLNYYNEVKAKYKILNECKLYWLGN